MSWVVLGANGVTHRGWNPLFVVSGGDPASTLPFSGLIPGLHGTLRPYRSREKQHSGVSGTKMHIPLANYRDAFVP